MKDTTYWAVFSDVWKLLSKYHGSVSNSDECFEGILSDANAVNSKYQELPEGKLAGDLIRATVKELERIAQIRDRRTAPAGSAAPNP